MEIKKRPRSRDKGEAKEGKGVFKRGSGTGQGPVGSGQGPIKPQKPSPSEPTTNERTTKQGDSQPVERGLGLDDILQAMAGQGQQPSNQGSIYENMSSQQQSQLQQQILQQMQAQQAQQQAQQQAYAQQQAQQQAYAQQQAQQQAYAQQAQHKPPANGGGSSYNSSYSGVGKKKSSRGIIILIIAAILFFIAFKMLTSGGSNNSNNQNNTNTSNTASSSTSSNENSNESNASATEETETSSETSQASSHGFGGISSGSDSSASLFTNTNANGTSVAAGSGYSSGWQLSSNDGNLVTTETSGIRKKYTEILGNGQDKVTILLYLCGTDLESEYAMASRDLQEMLAATLSENVQIVVFSGGCKRWQNDVMSNSVNQIYDITNQGLRRISENAGTSSMTDPNTLEAFIKWGAENYPANRMCLILWDHGGGSVSGYGYDQKYKSSGAMSLTKLNSALNNAGVKFDFIGFDACLMATAETALMSSKYADYLIASEETEPGIGWYYTNWLTNLSANTSMPTVEIGKNIIDDFTARCARECPGQATTLSIIDLAEAEYAWPDALKAFAEETSTHIEGGNYTQIAKARSSAQEFSRSSKIDQIDLMHFASLTGTESGQNLIKVLKNAVKYNKAGSGMTNAYGVSIYFPYRQLAYVDIMRKAYSILGIDDSMGSCISKFAKMQVSGQASSGGSASPLWSLLNSDGQGGWSSGSNYGSGYGSDYGSGSYGGTISSSDLEALLGQLFSGGSVDYGSYGSFGFGRSIPEFMTEEPMDVSNVQSFLEENMMNAEDFVWKENSEGYASIQLSEEQWERIVSVEMSMYYDDGEGYLELGLDNIFDFDEEGNMLPVVDNSWISIDGQPVAYYHLFTYENPDGSEYTIQGRVPVMINDQRADLILTFNQDNPKGFISGIQYTYEGDEEVETVAKVHETLQAGDKIDFLCDYYSYDGNFDDSYFLGEQYTVGDDPSAIEISNTIVGDDILVTYKFVDIFGETYWTPAL